MAVKQTDSRVKAVSISGTSLMHTTDTVAVGLFASCHECCAVDDRTHDSNLWVLALSYFAQKENCKQQLVDVLAHILSLLCYLSTVCTSVAYVLVHVL